MMEPEKASRHSQNYAEIHFETRSGDAIMESLKVFRTIGEQFRIALPILKGYVLVHRPQELVYTMQEQPTVIHLIYAKIGSLHVYHGLTDMTGELVPLSNSDQPDQIKSVQLPRINSDQFYFEMSDEGIGAQVANPEQYVPRDPTAETSLVSLTTTEKQRVDHMEAELSADDNESNLNIDALKDELASEPNQPTTHPQIDLGNFAPDVPEQPVSSEPRNQEPTTAKIAPAADLHIQAAPVSAAQQQPQPQAGQPQPVQPQPQVQPTPPQPTPAGQSPQSDTQRVDGQQPQPMQPTPSETAAQSNPEKTPTTLLTEAFVMVSKDLTETADQQKIAKLAQSGQSLLAAIKTLAQLDQATNNQ